MKKLGILLLGGVLLFSIAGCTSFKAEGISFLPQSEQLEVIDHFSKTVYINKFLGSPAGTNFLNITSGATVDALSGAVWNAVAAKGGTGAVNVKIKYYAGPIGLLIGGITFGLWAPSKIKITGDIVKQSKAVAFTKTETQQLVAVALTNVDVVK